MTENERRIVTLLTKAGPLSNKDLQKNGRMGWATVIKMVDRLAEAGVVERVGTVVEPERGRGRRAYLYDVSPSYPLAVGIDVEHETTTISLTNLKGADLGTTRRSTPRRPLLEDLEEFLIREASRFLEAHADALASIVGIGIGLPRLELVSRDDRREVHGAATLRERLSRSLRIPVEIDNNIRVYTLYEKWTNKPFAKGDFLLVSIRGGIGFGIFVDGKLFISRQGYPAALAHYRVVENGKPCWCGGTGCVETVVNERYFYDQYTLRVLHEPSDTRTDVPRMEIRESTAAFMTAAADGHPEARKSLRESARYLVRALAPAISILNVPELIMSGHFGPNGSVFARYIEEEIRASTLPELDFEVLYYPLEDTGFTYGAALLVLNDYFATIPTPAESPSKMS